MDRILLSGRDETVDPSQLACLICGCAAGTTRVLHPSNPERMNVNIGLCDDHIAFGIEEVSRRVRARFRESGQEDLLPEDFGR